MSTENQRLKELQKILGFKSQVEFARVLGIKQGSLSDIYREKSGISVSDSIKMKLMKDYSINIEWLEKGEGVPIAEGENVNHSQNSNNPLNSNISGNVKGNIVISHNDISKLIELQKGSQEIQKELNKRLETSQEQINTLLEILKTK